MPKQLVHIFRHEDIVPPGNIISILNELNYEHISFRIDLGQKPQSGSKPALTIVLGGTMNTYEIDRYPWLHWEKSYLKSIIDKGQSVYGICLGGQLVAEVLGSEVYSMESFEIGWQDINITLSQGDQQKYIKTNEPVIPLFLWHKYCFTMPERSNNLGTSNACPNQGFIYKNQVIGVQFHPEVDAEIIENWASNFLKDSQNETLKKSLENDIKKVYLFENQKMINKNIIAQLIENSIKRQTLKKK